MTLVRRTRIDLLSQTQGPLSRQMLRGVANTIATVTTDYTLNEIDTTIQCNGTAILTLPTATENPLIRTGQIFRIKNIGSGVCTVVSSALIDDDYTDMLSVRRQAHQYQWDGTQWRIY